MTEPAPKPKQDDSIEPPIEKLRHILWGENSEKITAPVKQNARELVSDVITEALNDRQAADKSVDKVLQPVVETALERSLSSHSKQIIDKLYPLIGSLIRKSVSAFINDFLEKTNTLIENSLTPKSLIWRISAWRSGISFSQYVASKTFSFRAKQIFLIHRETGLLLHTTTEQSYANVDGDSVSAMLTAINDFVSDSFSEVKQEEQNLAQIKTDNFTLLIKLGPSAILAAAVEGSPPESYSDMLQIQLEALHKLFYRELDKFEGDVEPFSNSESQLRECLQSQLKEEAPQKKPWYAIAIVGTLFIWLSISGYQWSQTLHISNQLDELNNEPGYVVQDNDVKNTNQIALSILQDPAAQPLEDWLKNRAIDPSSIVLDQKSYISLHPEMISKRVSVILSSYDNISFEVREQNVFLAGEVDISKASNLVRRIQNLPGITHVDQTKLKSKLPPLTNNTVNENKDMLSNLIHLSIEKFNTYQVSFARASTDLTPDTKKIVDVIISDYQKIAAIAKRANIKIGLLVIGTSDAVGPDKNNQVISEKRANSILRYMLSQGLNEGSVHATGIGELNISDLNSEFRKALFNVVYFPE